MPLIDGGTDIDLTKWEGVFVAALKKVGYDMLTNEAFRQGVHVVRHDLVIT